jgi:hypothetical protein
VTFKELKRRVSGLETTQDYKALELLRNKPFWIWDKQQHKQQDITTDGDCCFNHIIGLPQKDGIVKPLYDYEQLIFDSLVTHSGNRHLWIKKATGLGISEFMLRFMAWLCVKDNALSGSFFIFIFPDKQTPRISFSQPPQPTSLNYPMSVDDRLVGYSSLQKQIKVKAKFLNHVIITKEKSKL